MRVCIEVQLDLLPPVYSPELYQTKCGLAYQHVYDSYFGEGKSIYSESGICSFATHLMVATGNEYIHKARCMAGDRPC